MTFRELEYQERVLRAVDDHLAALDAEKQRADGIATLAAQNPGLGLQVPDFAAAAWQVLRQAGRLPASRAGIPYSPRFDGIGRTVPNAVMKVPTGGGKTYLAVSALSRILGRYLGRNHGFVLWVVPNEAIYTQTYRHLIDRHHPYRQMLDRAAAGRVKIMQKSDPLNAQDLDSSLCLMLLMLQSANRQTRDSLKLFQDRGDVHGFFPPEGDQEAHRAILERIPNLDSYGASSGAGSFWPMAKDSLGNALRVIHPVVVLDEGHRAVSDLAYETLYGFNPSFVLELTATPKDVAAVSGRSPRPARFANVLTEVSGVDLDREGMIKMPLTLDVRQATDWRSTLAAAVDRLQQLSTESEKYLADKGRYIRPILLVQVERTGDEQRGSGHVHASDAKDWLLASAGFDDAEIAIKTASVNDLDAPENQDLLSPTNRVRVIITKQALQEGWDCPFAYVLCALAASSNISGMTQLVGRILRQPYATKTGVTALDECYVITHHAETGAVVESVKQALEEDGLGDLIKNIHPVDPTSRSAGPRPVRRRDKFKDVDIYLPLVLIMDDDGPRKLDYDSDILAAIDWSNLNPTEFAARIPTSIYAPARQLHRIRLSDAPTGERLIDEVSPVSAEALAFDPVFATRMITDIIPNPWVARDFVRAALAELRRAGVDDTRQASAAGVIVEEMRSWLDTQRNRLAETLFRAQVEEGRIQFKLRADGRNWVMPTESVTFEPENARQLVGNDGAPLTRSLFSPIYEADFSSSDERDIAVYLDGNAALEWWHRNVAKAQYAIQGWKREKVYPDFIFAVLRDGTIERMAVLEAKGQHLAGNEDTEYKRSVLDLMSQHFGWDDSVPAGVLELVLEPKPTIECELLLMSDWKTRLPRMIEPGT